MQTSMGEVRVKAYGLVEFTRPAYVKVQTVVLCIMVAMVVFAFLWQPTGIWANPFFANLEWIILLFFCLEVGETVVMLGKFKARERALTPPGAGDPTRPPP